MNKEQFESFQAYINKARAYRDKIEAEEKDPYRRNLVRQQRKEEANRAMLNALQMWECFLGIERKL